MMLLFGRRSMIHSINFKCERISRAEEESRKKEELVNEIKRLQKILLTYRNDQNHLIDTYRQYQRYQQFLFQFAPQVRKDSFFEEETSHPCV